MARLPKNLPAWDEMSDFDKGAALRHVYRACPPPRGHRGAHWDTKHARRAFPCRYRDDEQLLALSPAQMSKHAMLVTGGQKNITKILAPPEYSRLYSLATRAQG